MRAEEGRENAEGRRLRHHGLGREVVLPVDPDLGPDDPAEPSVGHRAGPHLHRAHPRILGAIFLGGAIGTSCRDLLSLAAPNPANTFALTTFVINTCGALLIGLVLTLILERLGPTRYLRPFLCVGLIGGFTTMSAVAVQSDRLVSLGQGGLAVLYLFASLVAGGLAVSFGIAIARKLAGPQEMVGAATEPPRGEQLGGASR